MALRDQRDAPGAGASPSGCRVALASLAWSSPLPDMREAAATRGGSRFRVVEFLSGFVEPEWCEKAHRGFVAEGELVLEFDAETLTIAAGDGLDIPPGAAHRHKARPAGDRVRLLLIDPV